MTARTRGGGDGNPGRWTPRGVLVLTVLAAGLLAAGCGSPKEAPAGRGQPIDQAPGLARDEVAAGVPQAVGGAAPAFADAASRTGVTIQADAAPPPPPPPPASPSPVAVPAERKVIRSGHMTIEVPRLAPAIDAIRAQVEKVGGFLAAEASQVSEPRGQLWSATMRVPAPRLDETVAALRALGTERQLSLQAEDITEQYFDLEIQLANRRALEVKLRQLLERPSNRLSDLLEIEREVARVRGEIEQLEGRRRFWDNRVGLATLSVQVHEPAPLLAGDQGGVLATLRRAFGEAGDNFVASVAGVIAATGALVPIGLALLLVVILLRAAWRRWSRRRA